MVTSQMNAVLENRWQMRHQITVNVFNKLKQFRYLPDYYSQVHKTIHMLQNSLDLPPVLYHAQRLQELQEASTQVQ